FFATENFGFYISMESFLFISAIAIVSEKDKIRAQDMKFAGKSSELNDFTIYLRGISGYTSA
ncbi:MAG: hypothetical protein ACI825_001655, partial [Planctomycetota bacterium]